MKKLLTASWLLVCSTVWAGDAGTTSANFLKLGVGPRAIAMGEAQVAVADDVYATYWNPAGLSQLETKEAGFVQNQYFQDIREQYAAYAHPTLSHGTFAGSLTYLGVGNFQGFDATGQPTDNVNAHDMSLAFSYAKPIFQNRRLDSQLSLGLTGKWIEETLDTVSAHAVAFDGGLLYAPGHQWGEWSRGFRAGLTIRNLGSTMKFDQESFVLPRAVTAGLSYTGPVLGESVTIACDVQQPNDGARVINAGIEIWSLNLLVLRGGYTSFGDLGNGLRVGAGLRFKVLEVDYAFAGAGELGNAHRIGVVLRFGQRRANPELTAQNWYEKGLKDFHHGHYTDAIVDFNKALEIDSSHPQAYEMMQKTYEKLKDTNPQ